MKAIVHSMYQQNWYISMIPELWRLRKVERELKANLDYILRNCLGGKGDVMLSVS